MIAIIGVLVGLLLPAVQSAREAARRAQCLNHMKQIALALHTYASSFNAFPGGTECHGKDTQGLFRENVGSNWAIDILPFMDRGALADQFDRTKGFLETPENRAVVTTILPEHVCPSDEFGTTPVKGTDDLLMGPGSYMGVAGAVVQNPSNPNKFFFLDRCWDPEGNTWRNQSRITDLSMGPLPATSKGGPTRPVALRMIADGSSKTFLLGEWFSLTSDNHRGRWASSFRGHNKSSVKQESIYRSPDIRRCIDNGGGSPCGRSFGSAHPGIIQFAMCDASVQVIVTDIDGEIYEGFGTIRGEEIVRLP